MAGKMRRGVYLANTTLCCSVGSIRLYTGAELLVQQQLVLLQ